MDIHRNFNNASASKYELILDKAEQEVIADAYAWSMAESKSAGIEDIDDRLTDDFVLMALSDKHELQEKHTAYVDGVNIDELQDVLVGYQAVVDIEDRPVIGKNRHNSEFPNFKAGMLASALSNKLAYIEMNSRDCELRHFRAPIAPFVTVASV